MNVDDMGLFGKIVKLGMDVVTTPIAVVSDIVTLGGAATETESEIKKKAEQVKEDWNEIREDASK